MEKMIVYEAKDGTIFYTKDACKEYEEKLSNPSERVRIAAKEIQEFCIHNNCDDCPFMDCDNNCRLEDIPSDWNF